MHTLHRARRRLHRLVWDAPYQELTPWRRRIVDVARLIAAVARDLASGGLTLRAMSLVFTTLLAMVPLIAVAFSVLKGFGVHNRIEPALAELLVPLGPRADEVTGRIVEFVDNVEVGVLGAVGIALLLFAAVSLVQKIEEAFNYTWNVRRRRPFARRISDYFSVIVIGPVLVFLALGITATLTNTAVVRAVMDIEPFGALLRFGSKLVPYLLVIVAFTFVYVLIPNTRVRLKPALVAGVVSGVLWETVGRIFAAFVAGSTNYTAIYSSFAILLFFMIWLYLSWLILLLGSSIAFYLQYPAYLHAGARRDARLSHAQTEQLALAVMAAVTRDWYGGASPPARDRLAGRLGVPVQALDDVIEALLGAGLVAPAGGDSTGYLPGRPPERTSARRVLDAVRGYGHMRRVMRDRRDTPDAAAMARLDGAIGEALDDLMVADLAGPAEAGAAPQRSERKRTPGGPEAAADRTAGLSG